MRFLIPILFFSLAASAQAETLTIDRYIDLVKKEDLEIQRYVQQRFQTRFQKDLTLPDSRWVLSLTNSHGISTTNQPTTRRTEASLTKNIRTTGTELQVNFNTNTLADRQEEIQSVQLRQSLLRNFLGQQVRSQEESLDLQAQVTLWQLSETYEDYLAEKLGQYLDFVLVWQNFKTAQQQLKDITNIWKEVQQRRKQNIALSVDIYRAGLQKIQFERNVLEAQLEMERLRHSLMERVKDSESTNNFQPSEDVPFADAKIDFTNEKTQFLKEGRSILIHKNRVQSAEKLKDSVNRAYYPEAQLILGYNQDRSQRFSTLINRQEKFIGFNFTYEFDSSLRGARSDQALYNLQQAELQNLSEKRLITSLMESLKKQITLQKQRVGLIKKQVDISKKLLSGESKRFSKGSVDLQTLIDAQNSHSQARYELTSQKVLLARHILNWKVLLDQLVN